MAALLVFLLGGPLAALKDSGSGGTPNMRFFRALWAYIGQGLVAPLLAFLAQQEAEGHCLAEPFSASHGHMHVACAGVALWWAVKRGDAELVAALTRWWQREFRLCQLMPGNGTSGPWGPGARDKDAAPGGAWAGSNQGRSTAYRVALGAKMVGAKQKGNVGALALSTLSPNVRAELLMLPKEFVLVGELRVAYRGSVGPRDYIGWFPDGLPAGIYDPALSAGVWDGKTFISETVDQAALGRIALCGPLVVIPAARPF